MKQLIFLSLIIVVLSCGNGGNEVPKKDTTVTQLPAETVPTDNQYKDTIKRDAGDSLK